jgi:hypothetical protein
VDLLLAGSDVRMNITKWDVQNVASGIAANNGTTVDSLRNSGQRSKKAATVLHKHYLLSRRLQKKRSTDPVDVPFQEYTWGCSMLAHEAGIREVATALVTVYGREHEDKITLPELKQMLMSHSDLRKQLPSVQEEAMRTIKSHLKQQGANALTAAQMLDALAEARVTLTVHIEKLVRDLQRMDAWAKRTVLDLNYYS